MFYLADVHDVLNLSSMTKIYPQFCVELIIAWDIAVTAGFVNIHVTQLYLIFNTDIVFSMKTFSCRLGHFIKRNLLFSRISQSDF